MEKNNETEFINKITNLRNQYYSDSGKNIFFKNKQKMECATTICNSIGIEQIIDKTIYCLPNSNKVFFDYTIFKMYATPDNYDRIVTHALLQCRHNISNHGNFEIHINLNTFTVSACERYKDIIQIFCNECLRSNTRYSINLSKLIVYNSPNMIDSISRIILPFIDPIVRNKITLFSKSESDMLLCNLLTNSIEMTNNSLSSVSI
jgi:hypothetical protein